MEALQNLTNTAKQKLLHELFPQEIPKLLDNLQQVCTCMQEHREGYAKNWSFGLMSFEAWLSLAIQTEEILNKYRKRMEKSSRVFSEQFCFSYTVLFVNDRIIKYASSECKNEKFKQAVTLLFT